MGTRARAGGIRREATSEGVEEEGAVQAEVEVLDAAAAVEEAVEEMIGVQDLECRRCSKRVVEGGVQVVRYRKYFPRCRVAEEEVEDTCREKEDVES